jgi:hypothetical protein
MRGTRGVSLVELLVTLGLVLIVAGVLAHLGAEARAVFTAQPEAVDLVQRARVGVEALTGELALAGSGPWRTSNPGPLVRWMPPLHPRRLGPLGADAETSVFADRVTIIGVPDGAPQTEAGDMASPGAPMPFQFGAACPPADPRCGFEPGQHLLVFDRTAAFRPFVLAAVAPPLLTPLEPSLSKAWRAHDDAQVVGARTTTYYFDAVRRQLRRYDGHRSDVPVVDEVVDLEIQYFGDPLPPLEPRPPPGDENCIVDSLGAARLPLLAPDHGVQAELTLALLSDGPWCGAAPYRYDADLLRVRAVRVRLRVQAEAVAARGVDPVRFTNAGTAGGPAAEAPDLELVVDISPRNLRRR